MADDRDPFRAAKDNLRETLKWLATAFSGAAALVLAGASLSGFQDIAGEHLAWALGGALVGVLSFVGAACVAVSILAARTFAVSTLQSDTDLLARLEPYEADLVPPGYTTLAALLQAWYVTRNNYTTTFQAPPSAASAAKLGELRQLLDAMGPAIHQIASLAQFEDMRRRLARLAPYLVGLSLLALAGFALMALQLGGAHARPATTVHGDAPVLPIGLDAWPGAALPSPCAAMKVADGRLVSTLPDGRSAVVLVAPAPCAGIVDVVHLGYRASRSPLAPAP